MNKLIDEGYVIDDPKDLLSDADYAMLNNFSKELSDSKNKLISFYEFDSNLKKEDVEYFNLSGEDASVKITERIQYGDDHRRALGVKIKKAILKRDMDTSQIYCESSYDVTKFFYLREKICQAISKKYYSHIFGEKRVNFNCNTTRIAAYDEGCFIKKHRDGWSNNRIFVILLYLNQEWPKENGGELLVYDKNGNVIDVTPNGPKLCVLDFTQNNLEHEVKEIISGVRYNLVSFVEVNDDIVNTDAWKQNKKNLM
jgi:hypothetical protein